MRQKTGFSLIEMMIVIAIISILAAITVGIISSTRAKACQMNTNSTILQLSKACESYKLIQLTYPHLSASTLPADAAYTRPIAYNLQGMTDCNKRIRYLLEEVEFTESGPNWAQKKHPPLIQNPLTKQPDDADGVEMYMDAYGNPIQVWWGRDHDQDNPGGPDNFRGVAAGERHRYAPDIYSIGENNVDDVAADADTTADETRVDFADEDIDDIVSWQQETMK